MPLFLFGLVFIIVIGITVPIVLTRISKQRWQAGVCAAAGILLGLLLVVGSFVQHIDPGYAAKAYTLTGQQQELSAGYVFIAPWNRIYTLSLKDSAFTFTEGDYADDAFGAQTATGDYLKGIAIVTVRIDPTRLTDYITRFGYNDLEYNTVITKTLKAEMKRGLEKAVSGKETKYIMNNKDEVSSLAVEYARTYLEQYPFILDSMAFQDFQASDDYEQAIRDQARVRMQIDQAAIQESLNAQEARNAQIKADGEAAVALVRAQNAAEVARIQAENAKAIALIAANQSSETKAIQASADANVTTTLAQADANAAIIKAEAEAKGLTAVGQAYKDSPQLLTLKTVEIQEAFANAWNGQMVPNFGGSGAGFTFADLTEVIKQFIPAVTTGDSE
ncbi:hypothetical protein AGMMS49992_02590 [Clostridia bacterium]|nr:hypothetical protein AGMMS49992_02590 [Clostridia bacterium]